MAKTLKDRVLNWMNSFSEECQLTATAATIAEQLDAIAAYRENLIKGYGADHISLCSDLSIALMAYQGTTDQKKTLKRSLKRAMRRASDGKFTFSIKGDRVSVTPYEIDSFDRAEQAWNVLTEYAPDDCILEMRKLFNAGVEALKKEQKAAKEQAEQARKAHEAIQSGKVKDMAKNLLKRAGVEPTAQAIDIASKIAASNIK